MKKEEIKLNNESTNNNKEIKLLSDNNTIDQDNIILNNDLLSSMFKNPPRFEKIYKNEELNKFKDEILIYLSERNNHYMSLIKHFKDKMEETKLDYINQLKTISLNYNSILSSQALLNNKLDKFSNFELFINKTNDQLITHEIRINNLYSDFIKSTQKYDKLYLDNLELPGYIGKFAKFKNCQMFFEHVIKEIDKINQYKEKNNLDLKAYKEKLDGIIKSFHLLIKNSNEGQMKYIKQLNDKSLRECKDMNDLLSNRVSDLRIENAKYSIDLIKKNEEMNREWKKILEIKDNLLNSVNEKINNFKNIFNTNVTSFLNFKKQFEDFQIKFNEISTYKEIKNDYTNSNSNNSNNNNINVNLNNNSCSNYTGWYISSNPLPVEKKNWKNFPRKFPKRSKTKNKYLEKKQFIKSISNLNPTNKQINEINNNKKEYIDEYKSSNIIKLEDSEIKLNKEKEKETKKRNVANSLNKEKTINSIEKYKYSIENQTKRSVSLFKEPQSCKNVTKIEINSHDKIYNFEQNKKEENKNKINLLNKLKEQKTNIKTIMNINNNKNNNNSNNNNNINNNNNSNNIDNNNNSNNNTNNINNNNNNSKNDNNRINTLNNDTQKILINSDSNKNIKNLSSSLNKNEEKEKEKEKEKIIIHKFNKNKKSNLQSNKSVQSDDLENNDISNINLGNSNTLNTTNDINYSLYSTNSICNVNKFVLNDGILDINDRVIKELASELEQSTNKKDKLASNKKKIEENFKVICNKIAPLNLNKTNGQKEYIQKGFSSIINYNENDIYHNDNLNNNLNNNLNIGDNVKINTISTEKTEGPHTGNNNNICTININQNDYNSLNKKMDIFDKKLIDLESLFKEKVIDILLQMDNLQNLCYYSLNNQKKPINQKLNNVYNTLNNHSNININGANDLLNNNIKNHNSHDDYFIHSHSVKRLAPIIEIDPNNLQFSPSPTKTLNIIISNTKSKEQNKNKGIRSGFSSNFKDIKLFKKNDNKENIRTLSNMDNWDITKFKLITKNGTGVTKWINLNKLIKYEQSKTANISSNNGGLLYTGNYDNNK